MYKPKIKVMMPDSHNEKDAEWISSQLEKLTPSTRYNVTQRYSEVFKEAMANEKVDHRKDNAARREANIRLRVFVERCAAAASGDCVLPPQHR